MKGWENKNTRSILIRKKYHVISAMKYEWYTEKAAYNLSMWNARDKMLNEPL